MEQLTPTQVISVRVRELRKRRGLSAQALTDRCAELGMTGLKRQAITNLENGRRGMVTVDELLILAQALEVPPLKLLMPESGDELAVTSDVTLNANRLVLWFMGERAAVGVPPVGFNREARPIRWYRAAHDAQAAAKDADRRARSARKDGDDEDAKRFEAERDEHLRTLARVLDDLYEAKMLPPVVEAGWSRLMARRWLRNPDAIAPEGDDDGASA